MRSDYEVKSDVRALWTAVRGEKPAEDVPASALLDALVRGLPSPDYAVIRRYGVICPFESR